ncbi:AraC family transcriptional regulator [Labilibaculum antarcticum]|uniref:AraC family transcriptional regulator n=1 Tax=Labilibaculum antarcticum TaxID=1717717 RepID=A0A1Y1CN01_9BACT|nr:AraC family transcriptional regulator [Labilibaculum antarcticum]BAX81393.1 AraC family transcriptional regulator [Labilibaculum antarcticum]
MQFNLESFLANTKDVFHLSRITLRSKSDIQMHTHDYAEIFWIEEGEGFHLINGDKIKISPGYLCTVRATDKHTFIAKTAKQGITISNLAFHQDTLEYLKNRYFLNTNLYFWSESQLPFSMRMDEEGLKLLRNKANQVITQSKNNIHLDQFLLFIFEIITPIGGNENSLIPYWMQASLEKYNSPLYFKQGVEGFLSLTNRSLDHCNRILKKGTGKTLTETLNLAKITYAARLLIMTDASIKAIVSDCGFNNMGYFYRVFKSQFNMSPKDYRVSNKKII